LEDELAAEREKNQSRERNIDDLAEDNDRIRRDYEEQIAEKLSEIDGLKRALEE